MDITRDRLPSELVKILQLISESHFVAFDLEFSGITSRRNRGKAQGRSRLTLQEVYEDTKAAAGKYQVLQVGLTVVQEDPKNGCYTARPYNFYINPLPTSTAHIDLERIWAFQSGAVDFLNRYGFDFGRPYTTGIPYLSRKDEKIIRASWAEKDTQMATPGDMIIKDEDMPLIAHLRESIKDWRAADSRIRDSFLNIPNNVSGEPRKTSIPDQLNSYQTRLIHQTVQNEYPDLKSVGRTIGKGRFVQITTRSAEKQAAEKVQKDRYRERDVQQAVGFRWMLEALLGGNIAKMPSEYFLAALPSDLQAIGNEPQVQQFIDDLQQKLRTSRRAFVGHNCFTDLVYLYKCFIGDLPGRLEDFRREITSLFPLIIDTKYMASFGDGREQTDLERVENGLRTEILPRIEVPAEFDRYLSGQNNHEAGYDSFLTATIAIKLSAKRAREGKYCEQNKKNSEDASKDDDSEVYVTAPESAAEDDELGDSELSSVIKNALTAPITSVSRLVNSQNSTSFKKSSVVSLAQGSGVHADKTDGFDGQKGKKEESSNSSVVAVRTRPWDWSNAREVGKVKAALSQSSSSHLLDEDDWQASQWSKVESNIQTEAQDQGRDVNAADTAEQDLLIFSDEEMEDDDDADENEGKDRELASEKSLTQMIAEGEVMPRWDAAHGFWQDFGNRLQVNSSEEVVFNLT